MMEPEQKNDFYIGWQEKAPTQYVKTVKRFIGVITILTIVVAALIVLGQKGFVDSAFELGKISSVKGVLLKRPAPILQILKDGKKKSILLVGFGKAGAESTIAAIEKEQGKDLEGKSIALKGTLIYYQDKTVLELTEGKDAFVGFIDPVQMPKPFQENFGTVSLKGEILDPKCALGVMKPGYGKPHRACAVRCISGGITPVLRFGDEEGNTNYCILKGLKGEPINKLLLPYVADQLSICGKLRQEDDWLVLNLNPLEDIYRLKPHWVEGDIPMCH